MTTPNPLNERGNEMTIGIKFRYWDGEQMRYDVGILPPKGPEKFRLSKGFWSVRADQAGVLRYTGLKDKNGMEIYEGDIIRIKGKRRYEEDSYIEYNTSVTWGKEYGQWQTHPVSGFASGFNQSEVIGSIYENPELMK